MSGDFRSLRLIDALDNCTSSHVQLEEPIMRRPRDFDAELKALDDRARELKNRKLRQLGELVIATGADALSVEELAGALLLAAEGKGLAKEDCRKRGEGFFRSPARRSAARANRATSSGKASDGGAQPTAGDTGAA
jgi:DNA-binding protein H-NS